MPIAPEVLAVHYLSQKEKSIFLQLRPKESNPPKCPTDSNARISFTYFISLLPFEMLPVGLFFHFPNKDHALLPSDSPCIAHKIPCQSASAPHKY